MSCKSALYAANENVTSAVPSGNVIPLGTVIRKFGSNIALSGNGILIDGAGYYDVDASVMLTPSAADTVTVQLYKDGVAVPGAKASGFNSGNITLNIPAIVRLKCCDSASTLTLGVTAATSTTTLTIRNVGIVVEKI